MKWNKGVRRFGFSSIRTVYSNVFDPCAEMDLGHLPVKQAVSEVARAVFGVS